MDTAPDFLQFLKIMVAQNDVQILMKMTRFDFLALIKVPEQLVVEFFELLEIEDSKNFANEKTYALTDNPTLVVTDISPI